MSKAGIISDVSEKGVSPARCPSCGHTGDFKCFSKRTSIHLYYIPIKNIHTDRFYVCPECAHVFSVDTNGKD